MTPSEELATLYEIVKAHPEGIRTIEVLNLHYGELPDYEIIRRRTGIYAKLRRLEKREQIARLSISNQGDVWVPVV